MQLYSCAVRPKDSAITLITFTRKNLIGNTFLNDESIDQILKNQRIAEQVLKAKKQVDDYWEAVETQPTPDVMIQGYHIGQKDLIKKILEGEEDKE